MKMVHSKPTWMATTACARAVVCLCVVGPWVASAVSIPTRPSRVRDEHATVTAGGGGYGGATSDESMSRLSPAGGSVSPSGDATAEQKRMGKVAHANNVPTFTQTTTTTTTSTTTMTSGQCVWAEYCAKNQLCTDCLAAVGAAAGTATVRGWETQPVVEARGKETVFGRALFSTPACVWMTGNSPENQTANGLMLQVLEEKQFDNDPMCIDSQGPYFGPCLANM